ncbi:MAG TPA: PAS domain S-box protein [Spirochaetia bacterium]|nr:PAS domain S-box protein [Spirochaetia bacterium]
MANKVLIVDDEAIVSLYTASVLNANGYATTAVYTGEQAVELVRNDIDISLVLMDIDLGHGIDGTETATRILGCRELPIVFLTSHAEKEMVERVRHITRYGYVLKNSGEFVLLEAIQMAYQLFMAHRASEEREKRYHSLFADNQAIMLLIDPVTLDVVDANASAVEFYGWSYDQLVGMSMRQINRLPKEDLDDKIRQISKGEKHYFVFNHVISSGGVRTVEAYTGLITVQERKLIYLSVHDISDKVVREREVAHLKKLFQYTVDHDFNAISVHDLQLKYMYVSSRFLKDYGLTREQVIGKTHYEVFPDIPEKWREMHRRSLAGEVLSNDDDSMIRSDGTRLHVKWECRPWYEDDGSIGGIILYTELLNRHKEAQREIARREEHLRITLHSIGDAVISTDARGRIESMNRVAEDLTGWPAHEAKGRPLEEIFSIVDIQSRTTVASPVAWVIRTGLPQELPEHAVLVSRNGCEYRIADRSTPMLDAEGHTVGAVLVFRDVTEQYNRDLALSESERKYRMIFDKAPIGISLTSSSGRVIDANPMWATMLGAESVSRVVADFPEITKQLWVDPARRRKLVELLAKHGEVRNFEYEARRPDGLLRWFNVIYAQIGAKLSDGAFQMEAFTSDITDQKNAERELIREKQYLQTLLDTTQDGLWITDISGKFIEVNDSYCRMSGYSRDELLALRIEDIDIQFTSEDVDAVARKVIEHGPQKFDARHRRKDGTVFDVESSISNLAHGVDVMVCFIRDISERKRNERILWKMNADLLQQKTDLDRALRQKTFLIQEVNHRVKNNLQIVSSLTRLKELSSNIDLSDVRGQIDAIRIVHEKLNISDDVTHISFREQCDELLQTIFASFASRRVSISNCVEDLKIPTRIAISLGLIVNELAINAIKHGFQGPDTPTFKVEFRRDVNSEECVLVIENSGKPFPEAVDVEHTESLGLRLIGSLVQQIHGTVELRKSPTPRFTIRFHLPESELGFQA